MGGYTAIRDQHPPIYIAPDGSLSRAHPSELLLPTDKAERLAIARRLVADHCLYGVDVNPLAVDMAKLSLWLVTLQKDRPFTFLDHRLRTGDSLLGISDIDHLRYWTLDTNAKNRQLPTFAEQFRKVIVQATTLRQKIEAVRVLDVHDSEEQEHLLQEAEQVTGVLKLGADLLIAAQLHPEKKMRETLRGEFLQRFSLAVDALGQLQRKELKPEGQRRVTEGMDSLRKDADRWLGGKRPFHWPLDFPEIFVSAGTYEAAKGFSAIVGNPPFLGGTRISTTWGSEYRDYLIAHVSKKAAGGRGDLAAHFLVRAGSLVCNHGDIGFIMTNSIAQGDTREIGLDQLLSNGFSIHRAVSSRPWPGAAALEVAHLWIRRGPWGGASILDSSLVPSITPYLTVLGRVSGDPHPLIENSNLSFLGSYVLGMGFVLEPDQAMKLLREDTRNKDVLFPYLSGEDLNSGVSQAPSRWVINFHDWPIERAMEYPGPFSIVERTVKPERQRTKDNGSFTLRSPLPQRWWHYADKRPLLYRTIRSMDRILVRAQVSKTHAMVFFKPDIVFSTMVIPIALSSWSDFAVLQSNFHEVWTNQYSSSLKGDQRYTPSDSFENFPRAYKNAATERRGESFYNLRDRILGDRSIALTPLYNLINTSTERSNDIAELQSAYADLDNAVAAAYGWDDLDLEHGFHETKQGVRFTISERARREVLDRLLELNHQRYAEEVAQGLHEKGAAGKRKKAAAPAQKKLFQD